MAYHFICKLGAGLGPDQRACREWTIRASNRRVLPLYPDHVEGEWGKDYQVDVVGINRMKKHLILGECKWTRARGKASVLRELVAKKTPKVVPASGRWQVFFLGFAREGWNKHAVDYARQISKAQPEETNWRIVGMRLLGLDEVDNDLYRWASG